VLTIEFEGTMRSLAVLQASLNSEGLSTRLNPDIHRDRSFSEIETLKILVYVTFEVGKPLAMDLARRAKELGEDAALVFVAKKVVDRFRERVPKAEVEIIDTEHG
jgi:hypothetical protein